jgi:5-formyltetrahydrofolate cyclo-ligase
MNNFMTKENIRREYKQRRRKLSASQKDKLEDLMLIQFQRLKLPALSNLMTYAPIEVQNEYDPFLIEEYTTVMNENAVLVYPIINLEKETMHTLVVEDETIFEENRYGILEPIGGARIYPEHIQAMIVPLLAFDKSGNRVGYGKGYYDTFIKKCSPTLIKIGFSFFEPIEIDDVQEWDQKLNYCITPEKIYTF